MLPIPVNCMSRPSTLPSSPSIKSIPSVRRGSLPPSCFSELEVSDLENMLAPHTPAMRKGSLQYSEILMSRAIDLESMLPPATIRRRGSFKLRGMLPDKSSILP